MAWASAADMFMKRALLLSLVAALGCRSTQRALPSAATDVGVPQPLSGQAVYSGDRRPAVFPDAWPHKAGKAATFGTRAMVVSDAPLASEVGVEVLRRGGNAVDAAVAVGFALAVVYPEAGNLGGGGYMVIRMVDGRTAAIDYREIAPLAATRNMYLDERGEATDKSVVGPLASGVPGAVAGLVAAQARYGSMPLADVIRPAIRLAADGFTIDSMLARSLNNASPLIAQFGGAETFLPGGAPPAPGTQLRQPALARTLERIAERGTDGFYRGETARAIADELRQLGGIITTEDLARYQAVWREPVRAMYRGHTVLSMPPSSSGGVTIAETLNILEGFDALPPFGSAQHSHLLASAYQRAFVDRNEKLADPAFVRVPIGELTSKPYAARLRATIDTTRATPTRALIPSRPEGTETTHYSVVDAAGNAVATTTTINALYGSGVYIVGAGFFMNDEMDDFATRPGYPNMFGLVQGEANAVQPGKRMLSAMSPTIVLSPGDSLLLVLGARGGPRIITGTSQVIINVIDHRMTLADAVSAPRLHHQALPDTIRHEQNGLDPTVVDSLTRMSWGVGPTGGVGLVNAIMRVQGGYHGAADPRSSGKAAGY
jgi:gamma-glutamyltranspeptidase/glutathione hydrolase